MRGTALAREAEVAVIGIALCAVVHDLLVRRWSAWSTAGPAAMMERTALIPLRHGKKKLSASASLSREGATHENCWKSMTATSVHRALRTAGSGERRISETLSDWSGSSSLRRGAGAARRHRSGGFSRRTDGWISHLRHRLQEACAPRLRSLRILERKTRPLLGSRARAGSSGSAGWSV